MLSNTVKIVTFDSSCSGFILPCELVKDEKEIKEKYYVAFTNLHIMGSNCFSNNELEAFQKNPEKYIDISNDYIKNKKLKPVIEDIFIGESVCKEDDILAILIRFENLDELIWNDINIGYSHARQCIETCCFPSILEYEDFGNKMLLKGEINPSYLKTKINSYNIKDDYHNYLDLGDIRILEGLSGAPVYDNDKKIIGMNQSIPYFSGGENPFKTIYFISFKYILDYLREKGILLYDISNEKVKIRWIKNNVVSKDKLDAKKDLNILVLGGSGAGKSSFINLFALHKKFIDASGDGQTTRTNIEYKFSLYEKDPCVEINFLNKEKFVAKRYNGVLRKLIEFIFEYKYGFKAIDIYEYPLYYFKEIRKKLSIILETINKNDESYDKTKKLIENIDKFIINHDNENYMSIEEKYLEIIFNLSKVIPNSKIENFKYIFNDDSLEEIKLKIRELRVFKEELECNDRIDKVANLINQCGVNLDNEEKEYSSIIKCIYRCDFSNIIDEINQNESKDILNNIFHIEKGFFSISEFDFVLSKKDEVYNTYNDNIERVYKCIFDESKFLEKYFKDNIKNIFNKFYNVVHKDIKKYLKNNFDKILSENSNETSLNFKFFDIFESEQAFLAKCFKVIINDNKKVDSLTGIIESVVIKDSFSNDFSFVLNDLNINSLTFFDTYGLDHVENGVNKKELIREFIVDKKDEREKLLGEAKCGIDAVFYTKKLDSGRPTELEIIIPMIYEIEPQISLYCIFTGIDIFYKNLDYVMWKENEELPKAVEYLFSRDLEDNIKKKLKFSEARNKCIYSTFKKNIGAFCSTKGSNFKKSNNDNIRKILISILMKEKDSIDIISEEMIKKLDCKTENKAIKKEIKNLLFKFFKRASVTRWSRINGNTTKANAKRICGGKSDEKILGYRGVDSSQYRWDLLFNKAYNEVFSSKYTKKLVDELKYNKEKVEAIIINSREKFLGKNEDIYVIENQETAFKKALVKLYEDEEYNPFRGSDNKAFGEDKESAIQYLNDVVDFEKKVTYNMNDENEKKDIILNELVDIYLSVLKDELEKDREESIRNILIYGNGINDNLRSLYMELEKIIRVDDSEDKNKVVSILKSFIEESFKNKELRVNSKYFNY